MNKRSHSLQRGKEQLSSLYRTRMDCNNSFSQNYPADDVLRYRTHKSNLSAYMLQGFEIVDYTQSINKLHKQLL
jgi:hypothetical protein